ncbi:MAG: nitrate- and nitrite sensing domain-containing protein [Gammaproteobacteria bacterium]|nr:nitrate- and nitrite sensing domain-containing protein [Gammaproteobacteria bacterium]MDX5374399.1 nitrate- and nitrite sensing domain-containing protein [Gammaproteobacteria bacterium]
MPQRECQGERQEVVRFLVAARQCEIEGLKHLLEVGHLVLSVTGLVHHLQRERGASNLFLGSGGQCYGEQLRIYQGAAIEAERDLRARLAGWLGQTRCPHGCARFFARIATALHGLGSLPGLREQVRGRGIAFTSVMTALNDLIRDLLAVVFEAADSAADPQISRALVALFNFMQGKELAGQERAIGAVGFSQRGFDDSLRQALLHRIDAQERSFEVFAAFCDPESRVAWQQVVDSPHTSELERLRRIACTRNISDVDGVEMAQTWFSRATYRIDAMKGVEEGLEARLKGLCESRIETAGLELASADEPAAWVDGAAQAIAGPFTTFFPNEATQADGEGQPLAAPLSGRSVMDLVHEQSRRLQAMEDELHAARQALADRKVIERAKALLMKHRELSEDEAHRFLRQTAMNQNRRLAEVAESVVSMAEVLG